jgi:hypothetical protein
MVIKLLTLHENIRLRVAVNTNNINGYNRIYVHSMYSTERRIHKS